MMILDFIKGFSLCTNTLKNHNRANQHHKQELVFFFFQNAKIQIFKTAIYIITFSLIPWLKEVFRVFRVYLSDEQK